MAQRNGHVPKPYRYLLSLDGGGIRGFSELIILEEIMERIKWREKLNQVPIPADRFDLIGGTSTGGLIAILLGRLHLSVAEAIKVYEKLAGTVFSQKKSLGQDGTYRALELEKAIKNVVGSKFGPDRMNDRMFEQDADSNKCRVFVCAVGTSDVTTPAGPTLFRTYKAPRNNEYNCTIWQAARATSAAPTFFKRIQIGPPGSATGYVDAGLGYNNPIKEVLSEARQVFGDHAHIACVLSIGTGQANSAEFGKPGCLQRLTVPVDLIQVLKKIATDTGKTAEEMAQRYGNSHIYHRLDVDRGLDAVYLDEWKRLGDVRQRTKNYLKLEHVSRRVDKVVNALSKPYNAQTQQLGSLVHRVPRLNRICYSNRPQRMVRHFVPRQSLLAEVKDRLFSHLGSPTVVLQGMGGLGKTQLALDCCRHAEQTLRFMAALWIDASSPVSVVESYKAIASRILKSLPDVNDDKAAVSLVQNTLRGWEQRWLVVFDNYDNPKAFKSSSISDYIPQGMNGSILFTSRHQDSQRLGHCFKVPIMSKEESMRLLLHRPLALISAEEKVHALKIASMLGYLPLALDQAAAYISSRGLSLRNFIPEYNARKQVVLQEIPGHWEYRKKLPNSEREQVLSVFTTWEMSLDMIRGTEEERRAKFRFLTLAAFFDGTLLSERYFRVYCDSKNARWMDILRTGKKWDSYKLGDLLAECGKLSLLQVPDQQAIELQFSIHPLVCEWMKYRKTRTERREFVMETIEVLTVYLDDGDPLDLPYQIRQETVSHVDACLVNDKNFCEVMLDVGLKTLPRSGTVLGALYLRELRYEDAKRLFEQVLSDYETKFGMEHLDTLRAAENLAFAYDGLDQPNKAEQLYRRALIGFEKKPDFHLRAAPQIITNLAHFYNKEGRYDEAVELCKRALATTGNLVTIGAILAESYKMQGRYDDAEALYKVALACPEMGKPLAKGNLGKFYYSRRQFNKAEDLLQGALAGYTKQLGSEDSLSLETAMILDDCRRQRGMASRDG